MKLPSFQMISFVVLLSAGQTAAANDVVEKLSSNFASSASSKSMHDLRGKQISLASAIGSEVQITNPEDTVGSGSQANGDLFGFSVGLDGDTAVIGVERDNNIGGTQAGAAYVYVLSNGAWVQQAKLIASDGASSNFFGRQVAIDGNTVIVSANRGESGSVNDTGAVYVFVRSGTTWAQQAKLNASDAAFDDRFGDAVAISNDTVLVGARRDDNERGGNAGAAYVFTRSGTTWSQQAKLLAPAAQSNAGDQFGFAVDIEDDTAFIGAYLGDTSAGVDAGYAAVSTRTGSTWSVPSVVTPNQSMAGNEFGFSIALSGNTVLIGSSDEDGVLGVDSGAAYVFVNNGSSWVQQARLVASDGMGNDQFGISVALDGDVAIVGAEVGDTPTVVDSGAAYVFVRTGSTWQQQSKLFASDAAGNDGYSYGLATQGGVAFVGAFQYEGSVTGNADVGAVYVYCLACLFKDGFE